MHLGAFLLTLLFEDRDAAGTQRHLVDLAEVGDLPVGVVVAEHFWGVDCVELVNWSDFGGQDVLLVDWREVGVLHERGIHR